MVVCRLTKLNSHARGHMMTGHLASMLSVLQKRPYLSSFLAGALSTLSLPPISFMPAFLLMGWVIYHFACAKQGKHALIHASLGAYGWFVTSLYWISNSLLVGEADYWFLLPFSFFGIPILVTIFWMAGALMADRLFARPVGRVLGFVALIGLSEWGREFIATGFPWNAPGLIFLATQPTAGLAAYFGQTGLNFIILFGAAVLPLFMLLKTQKARRLLGIYVGVSFVGLGVLSWHHTQITPLIPADDKAMMRIVQPAIPQAQKWQYDKRASHLADLMAGSLAPSKRPIDLIIWPETAFAGDYNQESELLDDLASQIAAHHQKTGGAGQLLTGVLRFDGNVNLRNSALLIDEGAHKSFYDKTHLVPFGEYVPWRFIPFIDAIAGPIDFVEGAEVRPLFVPHFDLVLPLICYEAIFPALTGRATSRPQLIVNLTNDGWFAHSSGPYQHLAQTRMTAISYGISVVRVANTGISAIIDGKGAITASLGLGEAGEIDAMRPAIYAPTLFAQQAWLIISSLFFVLFASAIVLDRIAEKRQ